MSDTSDLVVVAREYVRTMPNLLVDPRVKVMLTGLADEVERMRSQTPEAKNQGMLEAVDGQDMLVTLVMGYKARLVAAGMDATVAEHAALQYNQYILALGLAEAQGKAAKAAAGG